MNGCSRRSARLNPDDRRARRHSSHLPDTKGGTAGTASRSIGRLLCCLIVSTINVNGIRAAIKERSAENLGLLRWFAGTTADIVCLQETRADDDQLTTALAPVLSAGWHLASAEPHIKGRSGVAILSRHPIEAARLMDSDEFGAHGRYLEADIGRPDRGQPLHPDRRSGHAAPAGEGTVHGDPRGADGAWPRRPATPSCAATGTSLTPRTTSRTGRATSRSRDSCPASGPGSPICPPRWSSWSGADPVRDRMRGGRGGGASTTTPAGASTTQATAGLAARAVSARVERAEAYALRWSDHAPVTVEYPRAVSRAQTVRVSQ